MIKAIIFDFDGVIADSERIHRKSFNITLKQLGIVIPEKLYKERYVGLGSLSIMEDVFRTYNVKRSARFWVRKRMKVFRSLVRRGEVKPVKGFMKFNKLLDRIGMKKMIASGGYRANVSIMLKKLKLDREFQFISREDVKERKPNHFPISAVLFSSGVFFGSAAATCSAIWPNSVFMPVAVTTALALP